MKHGDHALFPANSGSIDLFQQCQRSAVADVAAVDDDFLGRRCADLQKQPLSFGCYILFPGRTKDERNTRAEIRFSQGLLDQIAVL